MKLCYMLLLFLIIQKTTRTVQNNVCFPSFKLDMTQNNLHRLRHIEIYFTKLIFPSSRNFSFDTCEPPRGKLLNCVRIWWERRTNKQTLSNSFSLPIHNIWAAIFFIVRKLESKQLWWFFFQFFDIFQFTHNSKTPILKRFTQLS